MDGETIAAMLTWPAVRPSALRRGRLCLSSRPDIRTREPRTANPRTGDSREARFRSMIHRMTIDEQVAYLTKGCVDVVRVNELRAKLERVQNTGKPLTVK